MAQKLWTKEPVTKYRESHCQLSYLGLANVFCAGIQFSDILASRGSQSLSFLVIALCLLAFSFDIQRFRGGDYTRNALGFWKPDAEDKS